MTLRRLVAFPGRLFYGWRMIAVGLLVNTVGGGIFNYGFAVFFLPISRDLQISRAATSLIFSLSRAEGALEGPISGWLVDRFGPKYILFGGALVAGLGYILLSQAYSYATFLIIYLGVISVSYNAGFNHSVMTTVNAWFIRQRGLAFSITLSAFAIGGLLFAPLLSRLVVLYTWRITSIIAGMTLWAFVLPASLMLVRSPESMGLRPDGDSEERQARSGATASSRDFTVRQALRTRSYWWLVVATTLRLSVINTVTVHFIPMMVWKGTSETSAAFALGSLAFLSLIARLTIGFLGDRAPKNYIIVAGMCLGILGLLQLQFASEPWHLWVFVACYAVMEGVIPLNWALVGDFFGRSHFATLRGVMGLVYSWGAVVFPVIAGAIFDQTGSYRMVLWMLMSLFGMGVVAFITLRPPRHPAEAPLAAIPPPTVSVTATQEGGPSHD